VVRRILFALLALGPLTIALHYLTDIGETAEFALAAASLIPLAWLPRVLMGVGLVNMVLRKLTVRPVVLSVPGTSTPVEVPRLGPPDPPVVTD